MRINATNTPIIQNAKTLKSCANSNSNPMDESKNISFNGGGSKEASKITKFFAEYYGKFMLNSDKVYAFCKKISDMDKGNASRHFQVVGSLVTSGAYMKSTLDNKAFDKENARTLAVNQGLCFIIPTIAAYTVDSAMAEFNKTLEYAYAARQEKKIALGKFESSKAKQEAIDALGKRLKGFRTLIGIVTFTTIYRYISPVAITPLANWVGKKINQNHSDTKPEKTQENLFANVGKKDLTVNSQNANKINVAA